MGRPKGEVGDRDQEEGDTAIAQGLKWWGIGEGAP
jgi:hypothetical protein